MDATDVKIFCEMAFKETDYDSFADRHVSSSEIGRRLRLDEKTVRARIKSMEEAGFIKYYQALPNLSLFNLGDAAWYRFEALNIATKRRVLEHIQNTPNIIEAYDYLGPTISLNIAGKSAEDNQKLASLLANRIELSKINLGDRKVSKPASSPDKLDWRLLQKLRYDAHCSIKKLAQTLKVTRRMVEYRIAKILRTGTLTIRPIIDPQKQQGLIFFQIEASISENRRHEAIDYIRKTYRDSIWSLTTSPTNNLLVNLFSFTLREPEEAASDLLQFQGTKRSSLFILKEILEPRRPNWIDNLIGKEASLSD